MGEVIQFPRKPAPAEPGRIVVLRLTPADVAVLNALIDAHEARAAADASGLGPAVQVWAMWAECARVEREMVETGLRVMLALAVSVGCAVAALGGLS